MKNTIKKSILIALTLLSAISVAAKPARPGITTITQPDGTSVGLNLHGDERGHYATAADGSLLLRAADGCFRFAEPDGSSGLKPSQMRFATGMTSPFSAETNKEVTSRLETLMQTRRASFASRRTRAEENPGLFNYDFPRTGSPKGLVILVEFADLSFRDEDAHDYFYRLLNQEGFNDNGGFGSARDYFVDNSYGAFTPDFDVYGPVTLSRQMSYYGKNDGYGAEPHVADLIQEACTALDDDIDYSLYDTNGDGYVDNIFFFYAGYGEADSYMPETIWPHNWEYEYYDCGSLILDGVNISRYACSNELDYQYKRCDDRATFIHEFSHVMGLPDLYATTYSSAFTPAEWSVMDAGCYNDQSRTPPAYSAYERYALGWMEPLPLVEGELQLENLIDSNTAYIVKVADNPNEYFLFENRQKVSYDAFLPGSGMLVWHVDFEPWVFEANAVNNNSKHQYVDLVEADNRRTDKTRSGDSFPGSYGVTEFTPDTAPAFVDWNGANLGFALTDIADIDCVVTFKSTALPQTSVAEFETDEVADIYTTTGMLVKAAASRSDFDALPAGLYIYGNKKVLKTY